MNEFQIHLNDNGFVEFFDNDWSKTYSAFRLESTKFPGLTAKDGSYTKNEFRDLQQEAQYFGVNIIPEIDIPAHSLAFSQFKPEIGSKEYGMDHLDLYNPETYKFVDALLDEYIGGDNPVFIGKDVHIGTDEYNKKEAEKYRYFTDRYLKFVESYHKQPRMWGGLKWLAGKTPVKSKGVIVNAWSADWVDPVQSLKDGYELINTCDGFLYIVPGAGYYQDFLNTEWIYNNWSVAKLSNDITLAKNEPGLSGAMFAVWNDHCGNGISQKDVHLRTMPALQTLAQKMWNDAGKPDDYAVFNKLCKGMIEAPGLNLSGRVNGKTDVVLKYDLVKPKAKDLSGNEFNVKKRKDNVIETPVYEVGYPYFVQFDLNLSSNNDKNIVLFGNDYAKVYANWNGTGKIAFSREGYTFNFDTTIPANEWVNLRIDGTVNGMKLYINGKQVEELTPKKRECAKLNGGISAMYYQFTSFFPLQFIGDKATGFKGKMKNLMVKQEKYLNLLYNPARFLK
jgi:hexosaminidase